MKVCGCFFKKHFFNLPGGRWSGKGGNWRWELKVETKTLGSPNLEPGLQVLRSWDYPKKGCTQNRTYGSFLRIVLLLQTPGYSSSTQAERLPGWKSRVCDGWACDFVLHKNGKVRNPKKTNPERVNLKRANLKKSEAKWFTSSEFESKVNPKESKENWRKPIRSGEEWAPAWSACQFAAICKTPLREICRRRSAVEWCKAISDHGTHIVGTVCGTAVLMWLVCSVWDCGNLSN